MLGFLLAIPGVIWSVYYSFFDCAVVLRNLGGKRALDYSKSLVKGQWWRVCVFGLITTGPSLAISLGVYSLSNWLRGVPVDGRPDPLIAAGVTIIVAMLTTPLLVPHVLFFLTLDATIAKPKRSEASSYKRGVGLARQGKYDQAIAAYTKAIALDRRYAEPFVGRGNAYRYKGELALAVADYGRAIACDPADAAAYCGRGLVRLRNGNAHEAIGDLSRAIDLQPDDADAYYHPGTALAQTGRAAQAADEWQTYLRLKPDAPERDEVQRKLTEF